MSAIEITGFTLHAAISLIAAAFQYHTSPIVAAIEDFNSRHKALVRKYGCTVAFLLETCSDARLVIDRVESYVVHTDNQSVIAFIKSYTLSFNMIGIAGAIIAQVAISALALTRLEDTHWSVEAFFILSLVNGCLAVFFACAMSPALHGLHSAEDIKDFITKPISDAKVSEIMTHQGDTVKLRELFEEEKWKVASAYAAMMLVVPMTLLKVALNAFLVGLGIYLGRLCTKRLVPAYGSGSYGTLVFYLCGAVFSIGYYYTTQTMKHLEDDQLKRLRKLLDEDERNRQAQQKGRNASNVEIFPITTPINAELEQSRHIRDRNKVHYITLNKGKNNAGANLDMSEEVRPSKDDALRASINDMSTPETSSAATPEKQSDTHRKNITNILENLTRVIQAQEESLHANQRLLKALSAQMRNNLDT